MAHRAVWIGGDGLISVGGKPFSRGFKSHPARHFGRKIDFAPLGMPRRGVELIDLAEKRVDEFGDPLVPRRILRPSIGDKQCPVCNGRDSGPLGNQVRIVLMGDLCGKIIGEQIAQVMILQAFLIEREEMHAVFLLNLRQGGLRRSGEDDHCREFSRH